MKLLILVAATLALIKVVYCVPIEVNANGVSGTLSSYQVDKIEGLSDYGLDELFAKIDAEVDHDDAAIFDFDEDVDDDAEDVDAEQDDNEDVDSEEVDADEDEEEE